MPSTQDVARAEIVELPVLVIASGQSHGRGRSGTKWVSADRALAASLALRLDIDEQRPLSLMAGIAALRATTGTSLKWPNDVLAGSAKVGGILVERSEDLMVVGLGLNLWWADPIEGAGALFDEDPGDEIHTEIGALWGAELMSLIEDESWPIDEYRGSCVTLGRDITWEPSGLGRAVDVDEQGALIVRLDNGERTALRSGAVTHVRPG